MAVRGPLSPVIRYSSHNGRLRSSGRACRAATCSASWASLPGEGSARERTWNSMSKSGSSTQYGWSRPNGTVTSLRRNSGTRGRRDSMTRVTWRSVRRCRAVRVSRMQTLPTWPKTVPDSIVRKAPSRPLSCCTGASSGPGRPTGSVERGLPGPVAGTGSLGGEPVEHVPGRPPRGLELRHVADPLCHLEPPRGVLGGGRAGGRDRHEAVLIAVQQQDRRGDAAQHLPVRAAAGQQGEQGPGGHEELRVDVGVAVPLAG